MTLGNGEWLGACYLTLVLGALLSGLVGTDAWYEIVLAFAGGFCLALGVEQVIARVEHGRRIIDA